MSLLLPSEYPFGQLDVFETWLECDGPRIFIARNRTGQLFLFNALDEVESTIAYAAVPISKERSIMLRSGGMELRAAFVRPEDGQLFRVECNYDLRTVEAVAIDPATLSDADLPTHGAAIALATETLPAFEPQRLGDRATAEGRTLVALRLNPPGLVRSEYPVRQLSDALRAIQSLNEALVQSQAGAATARGPLSERFIEDAELSVLEIAAASFVAVLGVSRSAGSTPERMRLEFERSETSDALRYMEELLVAVSKSTVDSDGFHQMIEGLGVRALTKLRKLLEIAIDQDTPLAIYFAPPGAPVSDVQISTSEASNGIRVLSDADEDRTELVLNRATLVGVNLRTWRFELHDPDVGPHKFSGKVMERSKSEIEGLPTGDAYLYKATVVALTRFSDLTDEQKVEYLLERISVAGSGDIANE